MICDRRLAFFLFALCFLVLAADALVLDKMMIIQEEASSLPSNTVYLDDSFTVKVLLKGNTCGYRIYFFMDEEPFPLKGLFNGSRAVKCGTEEIVTNPWDLNKYPLAAKTHAVKVEVTDDGGNKTLTSKSIILRVLDVTRTTTSTTRTTTTRRTTTSTTTTTTTTTTTIPSYAEYSNSESGFLLEYPDYWRVYENAVESEVEFVAPFEKDLLFPDAFQEKVEVDLVDVGDSETLDSYTQRSLQELELLSDFRLRSSSDSELSGQKAHTLTYTFKETPFVLKYMEIYTKRNDYMYVLTYKAEEKNYLKYLSSVNRMLDSFQLTLPPTTTTTSTTTTTTTTTSTTLKEDGVGVLVSKWGIYLVLGLFLLIVFSALVFKRPKKKPEEKSTEWKEVSKKPLDEVSRDEVLTEVMRKNPTIVSGGGGSEDEHIERLRELEEEVDMAVGKKVESDQEADEIKKKVNARRKSIKADIKKSSKKKE